MNILFNSKLQIQAIEVNKKEIRKIQEWAGRETYCEVTKSGRPKRLLVPMLDLLLPAEPGDYIIKSHSGSLVRCSKEEFDRCYKELFD